MIADHELDPMSKSLLAAPHSMTELKAQLAKTVITVVDVLLWGFPRVQGVVFLLCTAATLYFHVKQAGSRAAVGGVRGAGAAGRSAWSILTWLGCRAGLHGPGVACWRGVKGQQISALVPRLCYLVYTAATFHPHVMHVCACVGTQLVVAWRRPGRCPFPVSFCCPLELSNLEEAGEDLYARLFLLLLLLLLLPSACQSFSAHPYVHQLVPQLPYYTTWMNSFRVCFFSVHAWVALHLCLITFLVDGKMVEKGKLGYMRWEIYNYKTAKIITDVGRGVGDLREHNRPAFLQPKWYSLWRSNNLLGSASRALTRLQPISATAQPACQACCRQNT